MIFFYIPKFLVIMCHLSEDIKAKHLTIKDPNVLWKSLNEDRYDHLKSMILS